MVIHARVQIFIRNVKFENGSDRSEVVSRLNVRYIIYYVEVRSCRKARRRFAKEKVYHLYDLVYLASHHLRGLLSTLDDREKFVVSRY